MIPILREYCDMPISESVLSIKQGESLSISGRFCSDEYPLDISSMKVKLLIWNREDELFFSTVADEGDGDAVLHDDGLITFEIPGTRTQEMLGTYYIECEISKNGECIVSDRTAAFEVVKSKISGDYGQQ